MLHVGLDPSRRPLDVCLLDEAGGLLAETAVPSDAGGLRGLAGRLAGHQVGAVIESMNGARFVHDTLEEYGWEVLVADAQKVKGLAPLAWQRRASARPAARLLPARPRPPGHQIAIVASARKLGACSDACSPAARTTTTPNRH
jgi:hypothetical protein